MQVRGGPGHQASPAAKLAPVLLGASYPVPPLPSPSPPALFTPAPSFAPTIPGIPLLFRPPPPFSLSPPFPVPRPLFALRPAFPAPFLPRSPPSAPVPGPLSPSARGRRPLRAAGSSREPAVSRQCVRGQCPNALIWGETPGPPWSCGPFVVTRGSFVARMLTAEQEHELVLDPERPETKNDTTCF